MLAAHNKKVRRQSRKQAVYEPLKHRMADVRAWERQSGRRYYDLKPCEREEANRKISEILQKKQEQENEAVAKQKEEMLESSNRSEESHSKTKNRRRSSLLDVSNRSIDPALFEFNTPASCYTDIGELVVHGPTLQQLNANDEWFRTFHKELLIPDTATIE